MLALILALLAGAPAEDPVRVVATIPDLADVARAVGGERVDVFSLARGTENVHAVSLRPSALIRVNRADLFLEMGLSLEHAYVPGILEAARNDRIRPGSPGFVNCSLGWKPIEVPERVSRADGVDLHPLGNPHFNLDPKGGRHIARRVLDGLLAVDPDGKAGYEARHAAYVARLDEAEKRWAKLATSFRGQPVVSYHREFSYFAHATGLDVVATIEDKPGVPPTPKDLARTVALMRERKVRGILTARWSNNKHVRYVAEKTGAEVIEVPTMVGGSKRASTWIGLMDELHERVARVLGKDDG